MPQNCRATGLCGFCAVGKIPLNVTCPKNWERAVKLRVGLIGLQDAWEQRYRSALLALVDRFEVRAVCDEVPRRAQVAATEFGAVAVDGYQTLLRREDIDAVLIFSTGWYGTLPVAAACEHRAAIYYAPGLDLGAEEAASIQRRVEASGVALLAELRRRHCPATVRLKELIATTLGPPQLLFCHRRVPLPAATEPPFCTRPRSSVARELVELVDWCAYVVGSRPRRVTGVMHGVDDRTAEPDYFAMSLDFSEGLQSGAGPVAQVSCGRYFPQRWAEAISYRPLAAMQISCQHGIAFLDFPSTLVWFDEAGRRQESLESEPPEGEQHLIRFHRAATSQLADFSDLDAIGRGWSIVDRAIQSHRQGRRLEL